MLISKRILSNDFRLPLEEQSRTPSRENRIVKITTDPNNTVVAEFAYDALGRRIRKIDPNASETTLYYYNNNWQVLAEYNASDTLQRIFIYGNYIDEVLLMKADGNDYYYAHDHLYSPAALVDSSGNVLERYEYDAYGHCRFLEPNFVPLAAQKSNYGNNYLFTGRRVDILDNGSLKIQYNRNRYYDYYTGRWLTHDPLGIRPNTYGLLGFDLMDQYEGKYEYYTDPWLTQGPLTMLPPERVALVFSPTHQYEEALNLYEYLGSRPTAGSDPKGLWNSSVHYSATKRWAKDVGYLRGCAELLAHACNWVDSPASKKGPFPWPVGDFSYHFEPGRQDRYDEHRATAEALLESADISYGQVGEGLRQLGMALHPLQDSFAHIASHYADTPERHAPAAYCPTYGKAWCAWEMLTNPNFFHPDRPDQPWRWLADYNKTREETKADLEEFLEYPCVCAKCKYNLHW